MKTTILCLLFFASIGPAGSQIMPLTLEPDGGNKKASVSEQIGIVKIALHYSRPGVKGREGKIYNTPLRTTGLPTRVTAQVMRLPGGPEPMRTPPFPFRTRSASRARICRPERMVSSSLWERQKVR